MIAQLRRNLSGVHDRVAAACEQARRDPSEIRLLAVTKSVPVGVTEALVSLGQVDLGENRVEVLDRKREEFQQAGVAPRWHFIGHVQGNKARRVAKLADTVHSVDSAKLCRTLDRVCGEEGTRLEVFLQIKLADEAAKTGLDPAEAREVCALASESSHLDLLGLMCMAPLADSPEEGRIGARRVFSGLADLAEDLPPEHFPGGRPQLSMGMSGDFEIAIEYGAHWIRVGSALFEGIESAGKR